MRKRTYLNLMIQQGGIGIFFLLLSFSCGFLQINDRITGTSLASSGRINFYDFSKGEKGKLIAKTTIANNGFQIAFEVNTDIIIAELENFSVYDFVNQKSLIAPKGITWQVIILNPKQGEMYNINPITTFGSALAQHYISSSQPNDIDDLKTLIADAHQAVGEHFGNFNIVDLEPSSLDIPSDNFSEDIKYALALTSLLAIPKYSLQNIVESGDFADSPFSILNITKTIVDDILFDGLINGIAEYGMTDIVNTIMPDRMLKGSLALALYYVANNILFNKTGFEGDDIRGYLNTITQSSSSIFGEESPKYLFDTTPPIIDCSLPVNGANYQQSKLKISCEITDLIPGVESVSISVNGISVANELSTTESFYAELDDFIGTSPYIMEVAAQDKIGNFSFETIVFTAN